MQKASILLLEDDMNLGETVQEYLEDNDYEVDHVHTSEEHCKKPTKNTTISIFSM